MFIVNTILILKVRLLFLKNIAICLLYKLEMLED